MKQKVEKIYALFSSNIVSSGRLIANAIEGYDVIFKGNALTVEDACEKAAMNYIPQDMLYKFTNPATKEVWYVGAYMIAAIDESMYYKKPKILLFKANNTTLFTGTWGERSELLSLSGATYAQKVSSIGYLSYPSCATVNTFPYISEVKLPLVW